MAVDFILYNYFLIYFYFMIRGRGFLRYKPNVGPCSHWLFKCVQAPLARDSTYAGAHVRIFC